MKPTRRIQTAFLLAISGFLGVAALRHATRPLESAAAPAGVPGKAHVGTDEGSLWMPGSVAAVDTGIRAAAPASVVATASAPADPAPHHGAGCGHCAREQQLLSVRGEFARMEFELLAGNLPLEPAPAARLLRACQEFADQVFVDISAESGPVQIPESQRISRRREILGPVLAELAIADPLQP